MESEANGRTRNPLFHFLLKKEERQMASFLPFTRARGMVRELGLESKKEWKEWSKSGQRPSNIPS